MGSVSEKETARDGPPHCCAALAASCRGHTQPNRPPPPPPPPSPPTRTPSNPTGEKFPASYTRDLKKVMVETGKVAPTGCPEYGFLGF